MSTTIGAHARRFRFGVEMQGPFDATTWAESAREIEALGYSTLFVPDHFHQGLGPITAMATAAAATTTLRVAPLVLACDFRHPAVLARELASIDLLSGGRLEVGLGAGYNPLDYQRSGLTMDPPGVRVDRLIEHTRVLRQLFANGPVTFAGRHYRINDLEGTPKPATTGGPPIIIAGGGPRLLRFAAAEADIIGVNPSTRAGRDSPATARDALPDSIDAKFQLLRDAAGERFHSLEFNAWLSLVTFTDTPREVAGRLSPRFEATVDEVLDTPLMLIGTPDGMAEQLQRRRERWGYSYIVVPGPMARAFAGVAARLAGT
ncbi:MAG: TIGR03621 family F420-dependent LLM class oxidoreductase [Ilumatobacteraceae bacterium]|nr:TIGR03621 family F420-dependent LLM class oxidoreductase [Ilumatobacteraceae bacterium]